MFMKRIYKDESINNCSKFSDSAVHSNDDILNIHFKNGYWNLVDNSFHSRTDDITHFINYEMEQIYDKTKFDDIEISLSVYFTSREAFFYFVHLVALSLKRVPTNNFLVLLGPDGNGQMDIINILRAVFECYFVNLPSECLISSTYAKKAVKDIKNDLLFVFLDEIKTKSNKKNSIIKTLSDRSYDMLTTRAQLIINSDHLLCFNQDDEIISKRIMYMKFIKKSTNLTAVSLTVSQKSSIFMYFAMYVKNINISINMSIPVDVQRKNTLMVNWKEFIITNFELRKNGFVSKELVQRFFKARYPDYDCSVRQITKALSELPAEFNVSYDRAIRNKDNGKRGHFFGLYSIHEEDNVRPIRDMEYEARVLNSDSS